jgi:hypothetical protein
MRRISLDQDTIAVLEEHRDRAQARAKLLDVGSIDEWYLFSSDPAYGRPLNPDWVTHRYTDMAAEQRISTHLHELRHYSATELLSAGVDLATVSGRLGHGGEVQPPFGSTQPGLPPQTSEQPRYSAPKCRGDGLNARGALRAPRRAARRRCGVPRRRLRRIRETVRLSDLAASRPRGVRVGDRGAALAVRLRDFGLLAEYRAPPAPMILMPGRLARGPGVGIDDSLATSAPPSSPSIRAPGVGGGELAQPSRRG